MLLKITPSALRLTKLFSKKVKKAPLKLQSFKAEMLYGEGHNL